MAVTLVFEVMEPVLVVVILPLVVMRPFAEIEVGAVILRPVPVANIFSPVAQSSGPALVPRLSPVPLPFVCGMNSAPVVVATATIPSVAGST